MLEKMFMNFPLNNITLQTIMTSENQVGQHHCPLFQINIQLQEINFLPRNDGQVIQAWKKGKTGNGKRTVMKLRR